MEYELPKHNKMDQLLLNYISLILMICSRVTKQTRKYRKKKKKKKKSLFSLLQYYRCLLCSISFFLFPFIFFFMPPTTI